MPPNDQVSAQQVASFGPAGVVISPGPCAPADAGISVDVVRVCGGQAPLLGVCLGHQAIATAFGATIVAAPRPVHGQTSSITHDGHGLLTGLSQPFKATRYHSLMVAVGSLPPFLSVTATARGPVAASHFPDCGSFRILSCKIPVNRQEKSRIIPRNSAMKPPAGSGNVTRHRRRGPRARHQRDLSR